MNYIHSLTHTKPKHGKIGYVLFVEQGLKLKTDLMLWVTQKSHIDKCEIVSRFVFFQHVICVKNTCRMPKKKSKTVNCSILLICFCSGSLICWKEEKKAAHNSWCSYHIHIRCINLVRDEWKIACRYNLILLCHPIYRYISKAATATSRGCWCQCSCARVCVCNKPT